MIEQISQIKKCCYRPPIYLITYDVGISMDQEILVCREHFEQKSPSGVKVFQTYMKSIQKLEVLS